MAEFVNDFVKGQRSVYRRLADPCVGDIGFPEGTVIFSLDLAVKDFATRAGNAAPEDVCSFLAAALNCTRKGSMGKTTLPDLLGVMQTYMEEKNSEIRLSKDSQNEGFDRAIMEVKILDISFRMWSAHADSDSNARKGLKQDRDMYVDTLGKTYKESSKTKESRFLKKFVAVEEWEKNHYN